MILVLYDGDYTMITSLMIMAAVTGATSVTENRNAHEQLEGRTAKEYFQEKAPNIKSGYMYPVSNNVKAFQEALSKLQMTYEKGEDYCRFQVKVENDGKVVVVDVVDAYSRRKNCEQPFKRLLAMPPIILDEKPSFIKRASITIIEEKLKTE